MRSLNQAGEPGLWTGAGSTRTSAPCRLLYVVGQLGPGGLERQLWYLLQAIDRRRYQPAVVVWNGSERDLYVARIRSLDVPVYSFRTILSARAKLRACARLITHLGPEVVHSYTFYTNFAAYWGVLGTRAVAIGSVRCEFALAKLDSGRVLGHMSARWPRYQIFNSLSAAHTCRGSRQMFAPKRLSVVRNATDLEMFRSTPPAVGPRIRIVGIGSLLPNKRWDRLCRIAAALKQRGFEFLMQIAGDGPLRGMLERQARELELTDCLEFMGHTDDIAAFLAKAGFLVHASDSEGCPNSVMEAMACGRAVVATDAGDIPSLVDDGKTGFVVRRGDEATLLARIVALITDADLCQRMGAAGRVKAEREFGVDRLVSQTLAAYRVAGWRRG